MALTELTLGVYEAMQHTRRELNTLSDLSEELQRLAGNILDAPHLESVSGRTIDDARAGLERLARWQLSNDRLIGERKRAAARSLIEEAYSTAVHREEREVFAEMLAPATTGA